MDKQWFPAAGIVVSVFLVVSASTMTLLSTHKDPDQFPSAPGTSARQSNSILLGVLTETSGGINSVERELETLGRRAGALSTEAAGGQEAPSIPGSSGSTRPSGRVIPESVPSALSTSAAHVTVNSQPVSSEAKPGEEILAPGTPRAIAMPSAQPSPTHGPEQKFIKASRHPCLLWHTSSPTVQTPVPAWRDGHSRPDASSSLAMAARISLGLTVLSWMPNTLKATEPLLPKSPGRSGLNLTSQPLTVGSRSSENPVALGTRPVSSATSVMLLPSATSPSHPSSLCPPLSALPLPPSPPPTSMSFSPLSSILVPVSSVTTGARDSTKPVSGAAPLTTDSSIKTSNLAPLMALRPSHPGSRLPSSPTHMPNPSLQHFSNPPHSSGFTESSTQSSTLPHPGQDAFLQDLSSSTPRPSHVTHSVTFRIKSKDFTTAVWNLGPWGHLPLSRLVCDQLQLIYHEAFPNFKNVSCLLLRPGSTEVKASLVFGLPDPSGLEILWTLYRKVKSSRWSPGDLVNSLCSDGYNTADLTREIINISFTLMRPFLPQLLLPGSQPFILLENQILPMVTQEVSRFYKADPQDQPLLLFSNVKEWVSTYMEYKFKRPIPTHLQGLASHLAYHITDPTLQKSSLVANGEKARLALYDMWLLILEHPFTKALANKTSSESQELRGLLTKWLTLALQPLQNFGQVVVVEFQQEPLTVRVQAAFFGVAPAQAVIQDYMRQALGSLQETEGLQLELLSLVLGNPSSGACRGPSRGSMLNPQLITFLLVLLSLPRQGLLPKKQAEPLRP